MCVSQIRTELRSSRVRICPNPPRARERANRTEARVIALFGKPYYVDTMPDKVTTTYEHGDEFIIAGTEIEGSNLNREPRRRRLG
jgi:hypothetical protein